MSERELRHASMRAQLPRLSALCASPHVGAPTDDPLPGVQRTGHRLRESQGRASRSMTQTEPPALPRPLSPPPLSCPRCRGAGWLRQEVPYGHPAFGKPVRCSCQFQHRRQEMLREAQLPLDYQICSFESYFRLNLSPEQHQAAVHVQAFVLQRLAGYSGHKRGLYLYGTFGVGKTGLAISVLQQALQAGQTGLYLPTIELFEHLYEGISASQRIKHGYGGKADKEEEAAGATLLRQIEGVCWLVLDDLGAECRSRFVIQRLYRLIEHRRGRSGSYTIFTSNKDAHGLERHWRDDGARENLFDDASRIIERLGESCVPIPVVGRNLREHLGETERREP